MTYRGFKINVTQQGDRAVIVIDGPNRISWLYAGDDAIQHAKDTIDLWLDKGL
jgi:hypothetical protein